MAPVLLSPLATCSLALAILTCLLLSPMAMAATGPAAPQIAGDFDPCGDGNGKTGPINTAGVNDHSACIDPGMSLYIDPTGGNWGSNYGPARYVTNNSSHNIYIPLDLPIEYQDFRAGFQTGAPPPNISMTVACRPANFYSKNGAQTPVSLCNGSATGPTGGVIAGPDTNGYAQMTAQGTVTASCLDQFNNVYTETQTFACTSSTPSQPNSVNADGVWQLVSDQFGCSPNAHQIVGACVAPGNCGTGTQMITTYDSCGNVTSNISQSCNTGVSCCTLTGRVDYGTCTSSTGCGMGTQQITQYDTCGNLNVLGAQSCDTGVVCCAAGQTVSWHGVPPFSALTCSGVSPDFTNQGTVTVQSQSGGAGQATLGCNADGSVSVINLPAVCEGGCPAQTFTWYDWQTGAGPCTATAPGSTDPNDSIVAGSYFDLNSTGTGYFGTEEIICNAPVSADGNRYVGVGSLVPYGPNPPVCAAYQCAQEIGLKVINNGGVPWVSFCFGDLGYGTVGQVEAISTEPSESGGIYASGTFTCGADGQWHANGPTSCTAPFAGQCIALPNGTVSGSYPNCINACNPGYVLVNNDNCVAVSSCPAVANGNFSGSPPNCALSCNTGYHASSDNTQCLANPTCPAVANGTPTGTPPNCGFTCNTGYQPDPTNSYCILQPNSCGTPPHFANGYITYSGFPACFLNYYCNPGYTLSGGVCVSTCTPHWVDTGVCGDSGTACGATSTYQQVDANSCPGSRASMPGTTPCTVYGPGYYMSPQQLNTGPIAGTASHPGTVNSTPVFGVYGPGQFNSDDPNGGVIEFDAIYQACLWNAYDQYGCPQYIFGGCSTGTNVQLPDCGADGGVRHYIPYCYFLNSGENYCPDSFDFNCNPGCNVAQPPNSGC